jgi:hypothetical protein
MNRLVFFKKFLAGSATLVIILLNSCINFKNYLVESDYSYSGNFKEYKTYSFINYYDITKDSLIPDNAIQAAIQARMSLLGYKQVDNNANILIGYKIYYKDFNFSGYNQPEMELWLKDKDFITEIYHPVRYKLLEGTMIIFLIDREMNKAIWQGYNSGLIRPGSSDNKKFVKGSVRSILDEYRVFAEGYNKEG